MSNKDVLQKMSLFQGVNLRHMSIRNTKNHCVGAKKATRHINITNPRSMTLLFSVSWTICNYN